MSTIAEISVPAAEFALESTFERVPAVEIEFDRIVARDGDQPLPHVWVRGADGDRVARALRNDGSVDSVASLADLGDQQLYWIEWGDRTCDAIGTLLSENASILDAAGVDGRWRFRLLFTDRDDLSSFYTNCTDDGPSFDLRTIGSPPDSPWCNRNGLTDKQRDTLLAALDAGYYEVPRTISMCTLATDLDVSHQALSERLRRGHRRLIEEAFGQARAERATDADADEASPDIG